MDKKERKNKNLMRAIKAVHGLVEREDLEKQRQSQEQMGLLFSDKKEITYEEIKIGTMEAEWVRSGGRKMGRYVILYCHGGAYVSGSTKYARTLTAKLATATNMDVLSFNYRLAPEHKSPAALEDGVAAWNYLMMQGYSNKEVILVGDSAGGNLALILTLKLRDEKRFLPARLVLFSPWTDLTSSGASHESKREVDPVLDDTYLNFAIQAYSGYGDLNSPYLSPLFADFSGFPPCYIQVGSNEILLDDSIQLQKQMKKMGVRAKVEIFQGMWHVFQMSPLKRAYEAVEKAADFIYEGLE